MTSQMATSCKVYIFQKKIRGRAALQMDIQGRHVIMVKVSKERLLGRLFFLRLTAHLNNLKRAVDVGYGTVFAPVKSNWEATYQSYMPTAELNHSYPTENRSKDLDYYKHTRLPDEPFSNFRASKSEGRRILCRFLKLQKWGSAVYHDIGRKLFSDRSNGFILDVQNWECPSK